MTILTNAASASRIISAIHLAPSKPTACVFGDSIGYQNDDCAGTQTFHHEAQGYFTWLQFLSKRAFHYPLAGANDIFTAANFGVSGDKLSGMLARVGSVISYNPDVVFFLGGTNDLTDVNRTSAQMIADATSIFEQLTSRGIRVFAMPILPRSVWSTLSSPQIIVARQRQYTFNNWLRNYSKTNHLVVLADPTPYLIDRTSATGDPIATHFKDGLHPNPSGAYIIGRTLWDVASAYYPLGSAKSFSVADVYDATELVTGNLLTNASMSGTAGVAGSGASGVFADGYTCSRSSGSKILALGSKGATAIDGTPGTYQQIVISSADTLGAVNEKINFTQTTAISSSNYAAGDVLQAGGELEILNASGKWIGIRPHIIITAGGLQHTVADMDRFTDPQYMPLTNVIGNFETPIFTVPASPTEINFRLEMSMSCTAVGSVTVRIGNPWVRKVI